MELPEPTIQALRVLFLLERTVLRGKQKWVPRQVFKMANGNDGAPWMSQPGKQSKEVQIHGFVQVSTGHPNHCNSTNPWLDFPGILGGL